ncbi:sensor histidine kinase [Ekhidna sp.]
MTIKLSKLYTLGLTNTLGTYDAFKLQIVNRLAVLCIGVSLILVTINLIFQNYIGIAIDVSAIVLVGLPVLLLNRFQKYSAAIYLFVVGYHLALIVGTYHSIVEGRQSGLEYLFVPGVISIIILVNGVKQYISVLINFTLFMLLNYVRFEYTGSGEFATYFRLSLILLTAYLMVYYFVMSFKTQLFRTLNSAEKLNTELIGKEEALLDSNKSKDRLFSIIAHDLRAPLGLIQGLIKPTILTSMSKEQYLTYSENVQVKLDALQDTMNSLLEWAKSQLGSLTVNPENVSVKKEIDLIVELFSSAMEAKNVSLDYKPSDSFVFADKNQFIIIVRNIIHNAVKFTPNDGNIAVFSQDLDGAVCVTIEDSGVGMDEETKERILKGQLIESTFGTAGETGSGIGLSFCQELLRKNNGRLNISNGNPSGTIFQIWLPVAK